ncbi:unnamed protein product [Danaus chrysippus]|uniref:(African queen) hypothetical protein n=1 Tax=Danaus chrysippus TaxID=151541 RepID=A0A8J2QU14_9NEOP|nr:unnamed protein product [Danaus chrysippus]
MRLIPAINQCIHTAARPFTNEDTIQYRASCYEGWSARAPHAGYIRSVRAPWSSVVHVLAWMELLDRTAGSVELFR